MFNIRGSFILNFIFQSRWRIFIIDVLHLGYTLSIFPSIVLDLQLEGKFGKWVLTRLKAAKQHALFCNEIYHLLVFRHVIEVAIGPKKRV